MELNSVGKRVLIAQQSTISHYRIPLFNTLESLRPKEWEFEVVFDSSELTHPRFFQEKLTNDLFQFPTLDVNTFAFKVGTKMINYQTFWRKAASYDLIIVENAVNNLTYPLCHLHKIGTTRIAYWGHGRDRSLEKITLLKKISESLKIFLVHYADGFFAYTQGVKQYLVSQGISAEKIFVLNNTVDINEHRSAFERWKSKRSEIRKEYNIGLADRVILFVGRFTSNKRIEFLFEVMKYLIRDENTYILLMVGSGFEAYIHKLADMKDFIRFLGPIIDINDLAQLYTASDLFVIPGSIGLGPLQALCYDLPVITLDSTTHGPEIEYLTPLNSLILETSTHPEKFAYTIISLFNNHTLLKNMQNDAWPSINHLTIENMAKNFIFGINTILSIK